METNTSAIDNIMNEFEGAFAVEDLDSPFTEPSYETLPAGQHILVLEEVIVKDLDGPKGPWKQLRFRFGELKTGAWSSFACGANFGPKAAFGKTWVHQLAESPAIAKAALKDRNSAWKFCQSCVGNAYRANTSVSDKDGRKYNNIISLTFAKKKGTFKIPDREGKDTPPIEDLKPTKNSEDPVGIDFADDDIPF